MSYSYLHVIEKLQEKLKFTLFLPLPIFREIKKAESLDFSKPPTLVSAEDGT